MKTFGNPIGFVFAIFLGIFFYFYYFQITFPITIILILLWRRKWVARQIIDVSNFVSNKLEKSREQSRNKVKLDKKELLEEILNKIGLYPNYVMDAYGEHYKFISTRNDKELFDYLCRQSNSSQFILSSDNAANITLQILEYLVEKFRTYDGVKRYIAPINFEEDYFRAVNKIKQIVYSESQKENQSGDTYDDTNFKSYPGDGYSGHSKRRVHKNRGKYWYEFVPNEPDSAELLDKFTLKEKQAFTLFGKNWYHFLSGDQGVLFWNVQSVIARIQENPEYREQLYPYFESTLTFIEHTLDSNPEFTLNSEYDFEEVFEWQSDLYYGFYSDEFWDTYEKFAKSCPKYKKYFDEFRETHQNQSYEEETDDYEAPRNELDKAFAALDLESTATIQEVRQRYRELTLKYHPDRNKTSDTTQKMTQINNAVDLIMDYFRMGATA